MAEIFAGVDTDAFPWGADQKRTFLGVVLGIYESVEERAWSPILGPMKESICDLAVMLVEEMPGGGYERIDCFECRTWGWFEKESDVEASICGLQLRWREVRLV